MAVQHSNSHSIEGQYLGQVINLKTDTNDLFFFLLEVPFFKQEPNFVFFVEQNA